MILILILLAATLVAAFPTSSVSAPYFGATEWVLLNASEYLASEVWVLSFCDYDDPMFQLQAEYVNTTSTWTEQQCTACLQLGAPCPARVAPGSPLKLYLVQTCSYGGEATMAYGGQLDLMLTLPEYALVKAALFEPPAMSVRRYINPEPWDYSVTYYRGIAQQPFCNITSLGFWPYTAAVYARRGYTDQAYTGSSWARRWCTSEPALPGTTVPASTLDTSVPMTPGNCTQQRPPRTPVSLWQNLYADGAWANSEVIVTWLPDREQADCTFQDASSGTYGTVLLGGLVQDLKDWDWPESICTSTSMNYLAHYGAPFVATSFRPSYDRLNPSYGIPALAVPAVCTSACPTCSSYPLSPSFEVYAQCSGGSDDPGPNQAFGRPLLSLLLSKTWTPYGGIDGASDCPSLPPFWGPVPPDNCEQALSALGPNPGGTCLSLGVVSRTQTVHETASPWSQSLGRAVTRCRASYDGMHWAQCATAENCSSIPGCELTAGGCEAVSCELDALSCEASAPWCAWNAEI